MSVTFLSRLLSISFKWHAFYTVLLSIVYPLFIWLILSLGFVVMLSCCMSLTWAPFLVFLKSPLWMYVWFIVVCFPIYFRMSSKGSVTMYMSNWFWSYCSAVICAGFTCVLFLVISHPLFVMCMVCDLSLWLWSPFATIVQWIHSPPSSCWTARGVMVLIIFGLSFN